jgi:hypothetical protein
MGDRFKELRTLAEIHDTGFQTFYQPVLDAAVNYLVPIYPLVPTERKAAFCVDMMCELATAGLKLRQGSVISGGQGAEEARKNWSCWSYTLFSTLIVRFVLRAIQSVVVEYKEPVHGKLITWDPLFGPPDENWMSPRVKATREPRLVKGYRNILIINQLLPSVGVSWIVQRGGAFQSMAQAIASIEEKPADPLLELVERCEAARNLLSSATDHENPERGRQVLQQGAQYLFKSGFFPVNKKGGRAWCLADGTVLLDRIAWWHSCRIIDIGETPEIDEFVAWAQGRLPCHWNADEEMMRLRGNTDNEKQEFTVWDVMRIGSETLCIDLDFFEDGFTCEVIPPRDKSRIVKDSKEDNVKNDTVNCSSEPDDDKEREEEKTTDISSLPPKPMTTPADRQKPLWVPPSVLRDEDKPEN